MAQHAAAHELDAVEAFVADGARALRCLPVAHGAETHAACARMLRALLAVLAPQSPRLARLVAQVWELAARQAFALLQAAQAAQAESAALRAEQERAAQSEAEREAREQERAARGEREREALRAEAAHLRAELRAARQRAARLAADKAQLRRVLDELLAAREPDEDGDGEGEGEEDEGREEGELPVAHPLERAAADMDALLSAVAAGEARHAAALNAMDRFVHSRAVALLWRFGSQEQRHQLLERALHSRHATTQTDREPVEAEREAEAETEGEDEGGTEADKRPEAPGRDDADTRDVVRIARALPAALRAQLTTRPRASRLVAPREAARLVLALYVRMLDADAATLNSSSSSSSSSSSLASRVALQVALKQAFMARYGLEALAERRLVELAASARAHGERMSPALADAAAAMAAVSADGDAGADADADALRLALFARLLGLSPLADSEPPAELALAVVDLLGDVAELDAALPGLDALARLGAGWRCPRARAERLLAHHLGFLGRRPRAALDAWGGAPAVAVDALLAALASEWLAHDRRVHTALRDGFRRVYSRRSRPTQPQAVDDRPDVDVDADGAVDQDTSQDSDADEDADVDVDASPLEALMRVVAAIPGGEVLAPTALEDVRSALVTLMDAKPQPQPQMQAQTQSQTQTQTRGRRASRKTSVTVAAATVTPVTRTSAARVGGLCELEFVRAALEVLRARRVCYGLRTHGRRISRPLGGGGGGDDGDGILWADAEGDDRLRPEERAQLKPGLSTDEWWGE